MGVRPDENKNKMKNSRTVANLTAKLDTYKKNKDKTEKDSHCGLQQPFSTNSNINPAFLVHLPLIGLLLS